MFDDDTEMVAHPGPMCTTRQEPRPAQPSANRRPVVGYFVGAVTANPAPGANVVTFGGIALSVSICAQAGQFW